MAPSSEYYKRSYSRSEVLRFSCVPKKACFRFLILFFNCLLTFGSYFCFDMPSVLQDMFQGNTTCQSHNGTSPNGTGGNESSICCEDCLGMSPQQYNLLYAIYAWTNAVIVIGAGFFIDKLGNRIGAFLFSFLCVLGSSLFAFGSHLRGTGAMLPVMLIGRLLFGAGNGSLTIVQSRLSSFWFKDKELAMAFGITLAFSRLGSVLNFLLTVRFADRFGIGWTLWGGAILCALGFASAVIVGLLDKLGLKQLEQDTSVQENSKRLKFTDIKNFNILYWLLALTIMFFYNGVFPFVADASKFIHDKYGYSQMEAAYIAGAVFYLSMVLSPVLGYVIDIFGKRGLLALACGVLTIPVFGLLAFTKVPPVILTLWLGVTYSFAAASMWPSIPMVVAQSTIGTAMGLTTSMQMIGIGVSNLCVGAILERGSESILQWKYVMIFLLGNTILCIVTALLLNIIDRRRDCVLNDSRKQKRTRQLLQEQQENSRNSYHPIEDQEPSETEPLIRDRSRYDSIN